MKNIFIKLKTKLLLITFLIGGLLLLLWLTPGELSPFGVLKGVADLTVRDGDFEVITLSFYKNLQTYFLIGGLALLLAGLGYAFTQNLGDQKWTRVFLGLLIFVYLVPVLIIGHLTIFQKSSFIYRSLFGVATVAVAIAEPIAGSTPTPRATQSPIKKGENDQVAAWIKIADTGKNAVGLYAPNDGSDRLFVVDKDGFVWIIQENKKLDTLFLDITDLLLPDIQNYEQGFLGFAFHPDYTKNGYFYVNYINQQGNTTISRFQVSTDDPNRADPESETYIIGQIQLGSSHNGGQLAFGADGYLYIGMGDGGFTEGFSYAAQSLDTLLGKILRIDIDGDFPYAIPTDNPFVGTYGRDEIWLYGFRNPWRFSFDRATGDLYIADVGQSTADEINIFFAESKPGQNYGWSYFEGAQPYTALQGTPIPALDFVPPIFEYGPQYGDCAVTGGFVYRGQQIPALRGVYFFGDFCSGRVWGLSQAEAGAWTIEELFDTDALISSFGIDQNGELYLVDLQGSIYKLVAEK